jgi:NADH-quinone oxidoreductase subunit N
MSILRSEFILTITALFVLLLEIFTNEKGKKYIVDISLFLFGVITLVGFIPVSSGSLFGGMFKTDNQIMIMKAFLNIGTFIVLMQSANWLRKPGNSDKLSEFYILLFSTLLGMYFMLSAGNFLILYLGVELASIPAAALAAYETHKSKSAEAGIKYLFLAAFSSAIMLYGISLLYGISGSLSYSDVSLALNQGLLCIMAFIFFFAGLAFKISLVPFHLWAADVYEGAPVNVTSYLSVVSKGAAVFALGILLYSVFAIIAPVWQWVLMMIALLSITVANLFAIRQTNLKRFLAFSSISQAGFILVGMVGGTSFSMASVIYFVLVYIFSNLGAFAIVSLVSDNTGKENMEDLNGFYKTNPRLSWAFTLALFSLAGIPPVAGFFSKFFLFTAAASKGYYLLVLLAVVNTIISLYYYLLPIKAMFINKNESPLPTIHSDWRGRVALLICIFGMLLVGFANRIFDFIQHLSVGM